MDAQGALDSLLGRLTTILVEEAQLLGRIRGDVEFIKEEMECMNSLILQLTEAQYRDHLVRAWMKQVVGLTRDCEGNVAHYIHYVGSRPSDDGLLGHLRRIARFLRTIPVRHRIATRIRELKVHARDVGDRRQRYGVTVPASTRADMNAVDVEPSGGEEDLRRRAVLLGADEPPADDEVIRSVIDTLNKCLSTEPATTEDGVPQPHPQVRVFTILGKKLAYKVAERVYQQHSSVATLFRCMALFHYNYKKDVGTVLAKVLEQVGGVQLQPGQEEDEVRNQAAETTVEEDKEKQLISKIQGHLKGKRFLIVVTLTTDCLKNGDWKRLLDALLQAADGCLHGSAIIMTTCRNELALSSSPYKIINTRHLNGYYDGKARKLNANYNWDIFDPITTASAFARKMFLHLLYVKPTMTEDELDMCRNAISKSMSLHQSIDHTMVMLCYNELPIKYRSCLLHLTVFPQGHVVKTTGLARRWIAEGLVATTSDETESEADKGGHYSDVLFIRGFISPVEISAAGNFKSFKLKEEVHKVIAKIAKEVNIVDTNLPIDLARHLSIHNRIVLPKSHSGGDSKDIAASLPSLAAFPQWKLLKVLDLEGCHGLEKQHLKSICKILLLKYLSLRNTDVAELPKQIKELQCLETLDIRQTKVRMLARKAIVLPLLKNFLAGHKVPAANESMTFEDSFSAVQMPLCIEKMNNMEILSHVKVSNSNELAGIAHLLKLRKLGVVLHGKHARLSDLFDHIDKLNECLRSLSIRVDPHPLAGSEIQDVWMVDPLPSIPEFIERLNFSGISSGLRHLIQEHHKLTKITLCEAQLKEDDLSILGKLSALHCLRLQHNSYTTGYEIFFRGAEFQCLNYLLVEGKGITKISFASGAAPKLERIVWSFARLDVLSGLNHLRKLKNLELNGDCDLHPIEEELYWHPNDPTVKHKPHHQRMTCSKELYCDLHPIEDRTAASTSSSSAP